MKHFFFAAVLCSCPAAFLSPAGAEPRAERVQTLIARLEDKNPRLRLQALEELGNMGSAAKEAVPALAKAFHDLDADVRKKAARVLAQIGRPATSVLIDELKKPASRQLTGAAFALALIGPQAADAVAPLTGCLKHKDKSVRAMAAHALAANASAVDRSIAVGQWYRWWLKQNKAAQDSTGKTGPSGGS